MGGWNLNPFDLRMKAKAEHRVQVEAAIGAAMSEEPHMPPEGIDPLRWAAMVKSVRNAIADNNLDQLKA